MALKFKNAKPIFLIFSFIILVFLLEIVLRVKHKISNPNEIKYPFLTISEKKNIFENQKISYEYKPYILWRATPNQTFSVFKTNRLGLRGEEYDKAKKPGVYRVILLGGSAAWGYGASSNNTTIGSYLERDLNLLQNKFKVEVLNFAENGYNSSQEYILWREISEYKPDLVIDYTSYNDIYIGFLRLEPGWNHPFIQEGVLTESVFSVFWKALKLRLVRLEETASSFVLNLRIYNSIKYRFNYLFKIKPKSYSNIEYSDGSRVADVFSSNQWFSTQAAKSLNISYLVVLQPSLFTENKTLDDREKKLLEHFEQFHPRATNYYKNTRTLIEEKLNDKNVKFIDGKDFFKNINTNIYFDTAHYFDYGNEIVASKISEAITSNHMLKK